jgi:protein TIF31
VEESTREIVRKAALAVGSLKETEFDIRFNPDVYSPGVKHTNADGEGLKKERQLVKEAADFLLTAQIPNFVSLKYFMHLQNLTKFYIARFETA